MVLLTRASFVFLWLSAVRTAITDCMNGNSLSTELLFNLSNSSESVAAKYSDAVGFFFVVKSVNLKVLDC